MLLKEFDSIKREFNPLDGDCEDGIRDSLERRSRNASHRSRGGSFETHKVIRSLTRFAN